MWLLIAALTGLVVYTTTRNGSRDRYDRRHNRGRMEAGYVRRRHLSTPPGPLMVLSELMQRGIYPPPFVIMCAIAEAQALGRDDIVHDVVRTFIAPVVQDYDIQHARAVSLGPDAPGGTMDPAQYPASYAGPRYAAPRPAQSMQGDEDIQSRLNMDPVNFMADLARQRSAVIDVDPGTVAERPTDPRDVRNEPDTDQNGAIQSGAVVSGAVDMTKLASPIDGVNALDWSQFCALLVREAPTFSSGRHVGQYRQNKDRLAELGIQPDSLVGRPDLQRKALDRDLADAHHHLRESGMLKHVGRMIALPGVKEQVRITLSGLLGVIQAAGIDGVIGWLEHPGDRKRFKHTTQAFTRTNGVF